MVGAGIAGLTLAAALSRCNVDCAVFEQTALLSEVGAGIQVAPNAARLLHRLSLERRLRRHAVRPDALEMRRWEDGTLLRRTSLGAECAEAFGAPYYTVHRADLHRELLELLPGGVLHLGLRVDAIEDNGDTALLRFSDGSSVTADVVVGADGIHSQVRQVIAADRPRFSGQSIYRALIPMSRGPSLFEEPKVVLWLGPGRHCVSYPVSAGTQLNLAATVPAGDWDVESWSALGRVSDLAAHYRDWTDDVVTLTSAPDSVSRWALHDRDTINRWALGRIAVVGDAAHPMLPFFAQGANQAIEDAMVLAGCLRDTSREAVPNALRRYESIRMPRTAHVHEVSRQNTTMLHLPDGADQRARDEALTASAALRSQAWLYGYDAEQAMDEGN